MKKKTKKEKDLVEEIEVSGKELIGRVKELIQEGNVRRLIIKKPNNKILLEIPLTAGAAIGGVVTIIAPVLAVLVAIAALIAKVKIQVVRTKKKKK